MLFTYVLVVWSQGIVIITISSHHFLYNAFVKNFFSALVYKASNLKWLTVKGFRDGKRLSSFRVRVYWDLNWNSTPGLLVACYILIIMYCFTYLEKVAAVSGPVLSLWIMDYILLECYNNTSMLTFAFLAKWY